MHEDFFPWEKCTHLIDSYIIGKVGRNTYMKRVKNRFNLQNPKLRTYMYTRKKKGSVTE